MAILRPAEYQHNNPAYAIADSNFVRGGIRTGVADLTALYALDPSPSAPDQFKEHSTIVYVSGESKYYVLTDITNIGNASGWSEFQTGGGSSDGTVSGATNGLTLVNSGTTVILGGNLTGNTTIDGLGTNDFTFNNINDFQITPSGGSSITFGIDENGLLFTFTGGSVSYDNNSGLVYGGDYSTSFVNESLVSKRYVDTLAAGLHPKTAVLVATTGNSITLSGTPVIDGVSLITGDRILVKDQTNPIENGIYVVTGGTWSRSSDFDGSPEGEVEQGALVPVISGSSNSSTQWILITKDPEVGVSGLSFTIFSYGNYVAGTGIAISGNEISVNGNSLAGNSIAWTGNTFNVDPSTGTLATVFDTKLDISTFSGYTGTTDNRFADIENDINFISGITDTKLDISTFSGYTATTQQTLIDIENDITYISGVTDTKLDISTFSGYTGTTQPVIDAALTGATNGLCAVGRDVCLGGTLIGDTTIDTGTHRLCFGVSSGGATRYRMESSGGGNGGYIIQETQSTSGVNNICASFTNSTNTSNAGLILCAANQDTNESHQIRVYQNQIWIQAMSGGTACTCLEMTTGSTVFYDESNSKGIVYGGDYENNFTARSLVTKQYVSGVTSGITGTITGGTNGLGVTGENICLGGTLSTNTDVSLGTHSLKFSSGSNDSCLSISSSDGRILVGDLSGSYSTIIANTNSIGLTSSSGSTNASINIQYGLGNRIAFTHDGTARTCSTASGFYYTSNWCGTGGSDPRWIPDNEYVTGFTQNAITQNSNVLSTFEVSSTTYTATTSSDFIGASGGTTIYLPDNPKEGQRIVIADVGGDALSDSIVICSNTLSIIGSQTATINTDYGSITFIYNGTFWSAAAFIN